MGNGIRFWVKSRYYRRLSVRFNRDFIMSQEAVVTEMQSVPFIHRLFALDGKVAVVTGGTGVLGGAMARGLAQAGARVVIVGRRADRAAEVAQAIRDAGGEAMAAPADVMDVASLEAARGQILAAYGQIDILINAAGGTTRAGDRIPSQTIFICRLPR